jgi:hypothetical protein
LAEQFDIHPNRISQQRNELQKGAAPEICLFQMGHWNPEDGCGVPVRPTYHSAGDVAGGRGDPVSQPMSARQKNRGLSTILHGEEAPMVAQVNRGSA